MRGCQDETVYPYQEVQSGQGAMFSYLAPFLYPLFLLGVWFVFGRIKNKALRWKIGLTVYSFLFGLFTYAEYKLLVDHWQSQSTDLTELFFLEVLAVLWGIMFMGLARIKDIDGLTVMIAFILTAVGLWWLPILVLFAKKLLIGAWIYIIASAVILLTYLAEYFCDHFLNKKLKRT